MEAAAAAEAEAAAALETTRVRRPRRRGEAPPPPRPPRPPRPPPSADPVTASAPPEKRARRGPYSWTKRSKADGRKCPERWRSPSLRAAYDVHRKAEDDRRSAEEEAEASERAAEEAIRRAESAKVRLEEAREAERRADELLGEAELGEPCPWTESYRQLVEYKERHGDCLVSKGGDKSNRALWKWMMQQRRDYADFKQMGERAYKKRYPHKPMQYRIRALNKLGFVWHVMNEMWRKQFDGMLKYKEAKGHCCVPKSYPPNMSLGAWVHRQRYFYKLFHEGKPCQLTQEKIDLLNSVGFVWSGHGRTDSKTGEVPSRVPRPTQPRNGLPKPTEEEEWCRRYETLAEFRRVHGHTRVNFEPNEKRRDMKLRDWCAWQRKQYRLYRAGKRSILTEERVRLLGELGFEWEGSKGRRPLRIVMAQRSGNEKDGKERDGGAEERKEATERDGPDCGGGEGRAGGGEEKSRDEGSGDADNGHIDERPDVKEKYMAGQGETRQREGLSEARTTQGGGSKGGELGAGGGDRDCDGDETPDVGEGEARREGSSGGDAPGGGSKDGEGEAWRDGSDEGTTEGGLNDDSDCDKTADTGKGKNQWDGPNEETTEGGSQDDYEADKSDCDETLDVREGEITR